MKLSLSEQVTHGSCVGRRKVRSLAELQPQPNQYLLPESCFCSLSQLLCLQAPFNPNAFGHTRRGHQCKQAALLRTSDACTITGQKKPPLASCHPELEDTENSTSFFSSDKNGTKPQPERNQHHTAEDYSAFSIVQELLTMQSGASVSFSSNPASMTWQMAAGHLSNRLQTFTMHVTHSFLESTAQGEAPRNRD